MVLFADLKEEDFNLIHAPIDDLGYAVGQPLVRSGETATSLYTLRSGVIQLVRNAVDRRQRIVRVLRSGDVGAMLDLKLETVSRTLSTIAREGLIEPMDKIGRVYRVVDAKRLASGGD